MWCRGLRHASSSTYPAETGRVVNTCVLHKLPSRALWTCPQRAPRPVANHCSLPRCADRARRRRLYSTTPPQSNKSIWEWYSTVEGDHAKLVKVAEAKVGEFNALSEEVSEDITLDERLRRARIMKELGPLAVGWKQYLEIREQITQVRPHLAEADPDLRDMFEAEHTALCETLDNLILNSLPSLLLPPPATAHLPVIVSMNAGVGGAEAAVCTSLLAHMYLRLAERRAWKVEVVSQVDIPNVAGQAAIKEITFKFSPGTSAYPGSGAEDDDAAGEVYGAIRWEKGVHRIQRVPPNDSGGRIQTSTVAIVILPLYPDTPDAPLVDPKDVTTEVMRSRGAGGQHVNKTESAVRLVHVPTGISVSMQDSRSQHQNRAWAWEILRARLSERKHAQEIEDRAAKRRNQVKSAGRSDKIRSYNWPSDRLTDHRIQQAFSNIEGIVNGDGLDMVLEALKQDYHDRRLDNLLEGEEDLDE